MNFCKDCKHFAQEGNATNCTATAISLVDGVARHSVDHCSKARSRNGRCGLDGRLFEPVEVVLAEPTPVKVRKPRAPKVTEEAASEQAE